MNRNVFSALVLTGFLLPLSTRAQQLPAPADPQTAPAFERPISFKQLIPNILSDQKRIWTFPAHVAEGQHWIPTAAVLGTAAGLIALDPIEAPYFRQTTALHGFNSVFTSNATIVGTIAAPVSFYVAG